MATPPPRRPPPQKRKSNLPAGDAVASRAVVPKKRDPRQAGIFDRPLPAFIGPQLAKLVTEAPEGECWAHELKFDGYPMHALIDRDGVQLITARSGLDCRGPEAAAYAYLDGELCAVRKDGTRSFSLMQAASDGQSAAMAALQASFGGFLSLRLHSSKSWQRIAKIAARFTARPVLERATDIQPKGRERGSLAVTKTFPYPRRG
jgi:hypothetical protein